MDGMGLKSKKVRVPDRKKVNLLDATRDAKSLPKLIPALALIFLCAFLFSKFAVADRTEKVVNAEAELLNMGSRLCLIEEGVSDYDEVFEEYSRYSYDGFDRSVPDYLDVLDLIKRRFFLLSTVKSVTVSGREMNLEIADIDMQTVTYLSGVLLEEEPLIEELSVTSYTDTVGKDGDGTATVVATVRILLADASDVGNGGM